MGCNRQVASRSESSFLRSNSPPDEKRLHVGLEHDLGAPFGLGLEVLAESHSCLHIPTGGEMGRGGKLCQRRGLRRESGREP